MHTNYQMEASTLIVPSLRKWLNFMRISQTFLTSITLVTLWIRHTKLSMLLIVESTLVEYVEIILAITNKW
ncbi:hypothetical protein LINPERPRIM_LOCUS6510 [Linum perenne]